MEGKKKVLVVDDEMHLRLYLCTVFETAGYSAVHAPNGALGLAKAREVRPDLISLDLMMPGQGGIKMLAALKEDPGLACVPVMIVSAVAPAAFEHTLALLRAGSGADFPGPEAFVPKPPDPELLLNTASRLLGASS